MSRSGSHYSITVDLAKAIAGLQVDMADKDRRIAALERRLSYLEDGHRPTRWTPDPQDIVIVITSGQIKLKSEIEAEV